MSGRGTPAGGPRAAVDVGTNSVRLLVVGPDGRPLTRQMTITRLGRGVDRTGRLDDASLGDTLEALRRYRHTWQDLGVDSRDGRVRIAATSAVRDAADRDRFFTGVRDLAGVEVEVLTGETEAALTFLGATSGVPAEPPCAVLDIGGGSTELVVGDRDGAVAGSVSLQLGSVRLTERLLASDPPTPDELAAARDEVAGQLGAADADLAEQGAPVAGAASLVGVAGTVTTLTALHLGLEEYDGQVVHATRLPRPAVRELVDRLAGMTTAQRSRLGPVAPGRQDIILGGALILATVLDRYGFEEVIASEADLLDGLVRS